jgi:hypothetical protein
MISKKENSNERNFPCSWEPFIRLFARLWERGLRAPNILWDRRIDNILLEFRLERLALHNIQFQMRELNSLIVT